MLYGTAMAIPITKGCLAGIQLYAGLQGAIGTRGSLRKPS
jgi:hypothetical protein